MEVYAIGGKPLMLDGKLCKVAAGGGQETWVLNEIYDFPPINIATTFISNANTFYGISAAGSLNYWSDPNGDDALVVFNEDRGWLDEAYRIITFLEPPAEELLTWLQANGVKQ